MVEVHLLLLGWSLVRWRRGNLFSGVDSSEDRALALVGHPPLFVQMEAKTYLEALLMFDFKSALSSFIL